MNLLKELVRKIDGVQLVDGELVAELELESGDTVVGVLPEDLRKHYAVFRATDDSIRKLRDELQAQLDELDPLEPASQEEAKKITQQFGVESSRYTVIKNTFWAAVRRTFPEILNDERITIKKGWQVVSARPVDKCDGCEHYENCLARTLAELVGAY